MDGSAPKVPAAKVAPESPAAIETLLNAVADLRRRVAVLEDREQIARLIGAYGPAVDSASADVVAGLWSEDGSYVFAMPDEDVLLEGRPALAGMVRGGLHQSIIRGGAGHVLTSPSIQLSGDTAVATCHSLLVRYDAGKDCYEVDRLSANRWYLRRTAEGWRVEKRVNRLLDGNAKARGLLRPDVYQEAGKNSAKRSKSGE